MTPLSGTCARNTTCSLANVRREELKINIGSAVPRLEEIAMEVTGRNLITGLPKTMKISSTEIYEALKDPISELIEAIQAVIERTPPQLASDIFNDGIVFTGRARQPLPGCARRCTR